MLRLRAFARWSALVGCLAVLVATILATVTAVDQSAAQHSGAIAEASSPSDEFVGPFPSWINVKTAYGARGDGVADDTSALQQGLADLATASKAPVLFLPSGTYRLTRTLTLAYTVNVSIVGEDPATTRLVWDGDAGGTMLSVNGVAYSRFSRLTFDGQRRASVAVEQSWDNSRPHFDTGNEYADDRFVDLEFGIRGGFNGYGFAETSIVRAQFLRNTVAGVALGNFNALDIWIWHSRFEDCARGVTNSSGAGNFRVYASLFLRSTVADLEIGNTGVFSARGNHSVGSRAFFVSAAAKASPALIHLQRNIIVDPRASPPIDLKNEGPGLLLDNVIRLQGSGPAVRWASLTGADVTSVGNTFTVAAPITNNGRLVVFADRRVEPASLTLVEPVLPGTPPNLHRRVVEVPAAANASDIQRAIDEAARLPGTRAVVHLPQGVYSIDRPLTIPSSNMQVVGDGYRTILRWIGATAGPLLTLEGPSHATLREIQLDGGSKVDGVVVEHADQAGARVYLDQVQLRSGRQTDLSINGLDHTTVELRDFGHAYSPTATSVRVMGGPLLSAGTPAGGKTNVFSGASSGNSISYEISGGASVLLRDLWYESGAGPGFARIHDSATVTVDGARIASPRNLAQPAFEIANLRGRATIIATQLDDRIVVSNAGRQARVLGMAIFAQQGSGNYFINEATPLAPAALVNSRHGARANRSVPSANIGVAEASFVEAMLKHTRGESPGQLTPLPSAVTDVRMFRVWVTNSINNIILNR